MKTSAPRRLLHGSLPTERASWVYREKESLKFYKENSSIGSKKRVLYVQNSKKGSRQGSARNELKETVEGREREIENSQQNVHVELSSISFPLDLLRVSTFPHPASLIRRRRSQGPCEKAAIRKNLRKKQNHHRRVR